jgi:excisionase family DNA binding protein
MSLSPDWDPHMRLLTISECAASVDRPASTIRRWLSEGELRAYAHAGRKPLILESELLETEARLRRTVTPVRDNGTPPREL